MVERIGDPGDVATLPRTDAGKLSKRRLRDEYARQPS